MSDWLTDVLIILGAVIVGGGLYLVYWPLAVIWLGVLLLAVGMFRLPKRGK